jgi:hypothetical protein
MNYFAAFFENSFSSLSLSCLCYWHCCLYFTCLSQGGLIIYCLTSSTERKPPSEVPACSRFFCFKVLQGGLGLLHPAAAFAIGSWLFWRPYFLSKARLNPEILLQRYNWTGAWEVSGYSCQNSFQLVSFLNFIVIFSRFFYCYAGGTLW